MSGYLDRSIAPVGRRQALRLAGAGFAAAVLAACGEDGPASQPLFIDPGALDTGTGDAPAAFDPDEWDGPVEHVLAIDNTFNPDVVEVAVGTMVVWRNAGVQEHDVIPFGDDPDDPTWGVVIDDFRPGTEYAHVFTEPGEHPYLCTLHGTERGFGMVGTIIVT